MVDRQYHLQKAGVMVKGAVSAAIDASDYGKAVEWLDQGHSVIWGQLLQLRTRDNALKDRHPDLAEKLTVLSKQLERISTQEINLEEYGSGHQQDLTSTY